MFSCSENNNLKNSEYPEYNKFNKLKIVNIHPQGWIKTFLERQKTGLTGNINVAGYPYDTKMWATEKIKGSQKAWWPYEQTAYYIDGANRLGYLLDDDSLLNIAKVQTQYVLDHISPETGRVSTNLQDRWERWPYAPFFRTFMTNYEVSGDRKIVDALHKHYLTFTAKDFADDLELANVEEICWLYGITKDQKLLDIAEEAYRLFKSDIKYRNRSEGGEEHNIVFGSDRVPDMHGVVYLELVKIPAILYSYTGNKAYLDEAENGIAKMEKHHMLISGLPSSTEHFKGISDLAGHETCNTAVFPHSYGYLMRINGNAKLGDKIEKAVFNAGIGSVTKDFKSHQYFSAPNQILATMESNLYGHNPARMAFAPGHDVECCTGNVNRFMPYYVEQMWLSGANNGLVAALYGPSSVSAKVGKNQTAIEITEETKYPFSETINFKFSVKEKVTFPFLLRIPEWTDSPKITINGKKTELKIIPGTFFKLEREFSNGDIISLSIPMKVKTSSWPNNQIGVERGPLVYSYSIPKKESIIKDYERSNENFPAYEMHPKGSWNYALSLSNGEIEVEQNEIKNYPWDEGNSPIKIKVPVKKVNNWKLEKVADYQLSYDVFKTPSIPEKLELNDELEYIELVPYGGTTLRVTLFPKDKNIPKVKNGTIDRIENFKSKYVTARNVDVWLPSNYDSNKKYSVIYMNDGQTLFDASMSWLNDEWGVDEMMGKLLNKKAIKNTIIVGIWNSGNERVKDYFPQKPFESLSQKYIDSLRIELAKVEYTATMLDEIKSDNYLKFIVEELIPLINTKYNTKTDKQNTFIMGSSYGGLISMYAICEYPEVFGGAACLSTHWIGSFNDNPIIANSFIDYFAKNAPNPSNHKIYFDYGTETLDAFYEPYQLKIDSLIRLKGYDKSNWKTLKFEGKNHSEAAWRERLDVPLTFLIGY